MSGSHENWTAKFKFLHHTRGIFWVLAWIRIHILIHYPWFANCFASQIPFHAKYCVLSYSIDLVLTLSKHNRLNTFLMPWLYMLHSLIFCAVTQYKCLIMLMIIKPCNKSFQQQMFGIPTNSIVGYGYGWHQSHNVCPHNRPPDGFQGPYEPSAPYEFHRNWTWLKVDVPDNGWHILPTRSYQMCEYRDAILP